MEQNSTAGDVADQHYTAAVADQHSTAAVAEQHSTAVVDEQHSTAAVAEHSRANLHCRGQHHMHRVRIAAVSSANLPAEMADAAVAPAGPLLGLMA